MFAAIAASNICMRLNSNVSIVLQEILDKSKTGNIEFFSYLWNHTTRRGVFHSEKMFAGGIKNQRSLVRDSASLPIKWVMK